MDTCTCNNCSTVYPSFLPLCPECRKPPTKPTPPAPRPQPSFCPPLPLPARMTHAGFDQMYPKGGASRLAIDIYRGREGNT